jgi:hypothetical protein
MNVIRWGGAQVFLKVRPCFVAPAALYEQLGSEDVRHGDFRGGPLQMI